MKKTLRLFIPMKKLLVTDCFNWLIVTSNLFIPMKIMTETTNGFVLSERDLELRGPGEVFGARQSGVPQFAVGDIVTDFNILEVARQEASALWKVKEWWQYPAYQGLANRVKPQDEAAQFFD